ncbi:DUF4317 domain-containing protein [Clostridium swellfunianum]|uniref:DUF4317 family protein n=1 Tax=Clostridium swellfunianum TaxID=1367462 RepID=UPI00202E4069|nr:DUF4317 family protein [Clostridium swellfunianum]MCM0648971.1 DUF4317 domain-containing protein [Clostridium swellfunianum]
MNKKELNRMKKEFKLDSVMLNFKEIYNVYIKKDSNSVLYSNLSYFPMIDTEAQELYLNNFKKMLGGALDSKLFELPFIAVEEGNEAQLNFDSMYRSEDSENFTQGADKIVAKLLENYTYETDVVLTLAKGDYWVGNKNRKASDEIQELDEVIQSLNFVIGSINKVEPFKKSLVFSYEEKEFKPSSVLDTFINLNTPLDGFMFPTFDNGYADVNKVMYYNSKPKELNYRFIENILSCSMKLTAEEEKQCFTDIIKTVVGESVRPEVIEDMYTKIDELKELHDENEETAITLSDMKYILNGIEEKDIEVLERAFEDTCGKDYSFNVKNILPDFKSKSLKIWNEDLSISMSPKNLSFIKQVKGDDGGRYLMIELADDVNIDGFKLTAEE